MDRPSVIVFNNLNNNLIDISDSDDELEILYDSGPVLPVSNQISVIVPRNNNNEQENELENEIVEPEQYEHENEIEIVAQEPEAEEPELDYEDYLARLREHYSLQNETQQYSRKYKMLFTHFKTILQPNIFTVTNPEHFLDLFRDIFQDVLNTVLERVDEAYPNQFDRVRVSIHGEGLNVNLQFVQLSDLTSELFLIELYKVLQSRRDFITSTEIALSFTFLPKKEN